MKSQHGLKVLEDPTPPLKGDFSMELADFIQKCMHKEPEKRPSAAELLVHPFVQKVSLSVRVLHSKQIIYF